MEVPTLLLLGGAAAAASLHLTIRLEASLGRPESGFKIRQEATRGMTGSRTTRQRKRVGGSTRMRPSKFCDWNAEFCYVVS